jgi:hypothetical protein
MHELNTPYNEPETEREICACERDYLSRNEICCSECMSELQKLSIFLDKVENQYSDIQLLFIEMSGHWVVEVFDLTKECEIKPIEVTDGFVTFLAQKYFYRIWDTKKSNNVEYQILELSDMEFIDWNELK